ncbi:uncharacterized protein PITG_20267 [Phytophthora infestans T30-4]|uniref:Tc1-like transposase DDE domain-containing protein n=1 Tax=Phytophthora infestans (strain T30-4) TaxID=403677 RepID=D0P237_PHYIT|nr:uncharacterized protein PITG_20267 [Phytophthora infestans T30-4]EEY55460.1 conserved hypothetical protein [Phytophthora infestans T30-4]|eukprot:XP_002895637.1 conserved hypothetical protein [Phytophthora infestans T30-4]
MHKKPQYMNTMTNKQKRRTYLAELQEYQAMGKIILYMDETNFNLWSTRTRGRSLRGRRAMKKVFAGGGQNMHVIACISENGLVYNETKFVTNRHANTNDFIRSLLRHIRDASELTLADVVLVLDNTPCHCRAESSLLKAFMRENRRQILGVPPGVTMKDHRQYFLQTAANQYLPEVTTAASCRKFYRHTPYNVDPFMYT